MSSNIIKDFKIIGYIHSDFKSKFGIPRQSGLVDTLDSFIIFEPEFQVAEAFKGISDFSHLWLIWLFSETMHTKWSPTVRPPKLGGNIRKGVFATRSPFRPNPIGLSCVRFDKLEIHPKYGPVLHVKGADLLDGTPILDIKPYLPYTESHVDAFGGFSEQHKNDQLDVVFPKELLALIPENKHQSIIKVLSLDPRPGYHHDPERIYGLSFTDWDVRFRVQGSILTVCEVVHV